MRYEIKGETLPVVICYLEGGETMITERVHELDVAKYENGDNIRRWDRKSNRQDVCR